MRKKITQRIISGVLSIAMCAGLLTSNLVSYATELPDDPATVEATTEVTTEATTEAEPPSAEDVTTEAEVTTESTTEVTTEAPTAEEVTEEFDHFYETGLNTAALKTKDFSSCELLVAADPSVFTKNTEVVSEYCGVYLLRFSSEEETMYAYSYYYDKADMIDVNAVIYKAAGMEDEGQADLSDINQGDDALSEASALPEEKMSGTIALIDTGCEGDNVKNAVSVLGGDTKDDNGHGTKMYNAIVAEYPQAEILSIKALDDKGSAQASDVYAAIMYAMESDVDIINLSFSAYATQKSEIVENAIKEATEKGIIVVASAGNKGRKAVYYTPARLDFIYVAGACDKTGKKQSFSNYGPTVDYNVVASSTSEAAAILSAILARDGEDKLEVNNGKLFATDYEPDVPDDDTATDGDATEDDEFSADDLSSTVMVHQRPSEDFSANFLTFSGTYTGSTPFIVTSGSKTTEGYCMQAHVSSPPKNPAVPYTEGTRIYGPMQNAAIASDYALAMYSYGGFVTDPNIRLHDTFDTNDEDGGTYGTYLITDSTGNIKAVRGLMIEGLVYEMTPKEARSLTQTAVHAATVESDDPTSRPYKNKIGTVRGKNAANAQSVADAYTALTNLSDRIFAVAYNSYGNTYSNQELINIMNGEVGASENNVNSYSQKFIVSIWNNSTGAWDNYSSVMNLLEDYKNADGKVSIKISYTSRGICNKLVTNASSGNVTVAHNYNAFTVGSGGYEKTECFDYFHVTENSDNTVPFTVTYDKVTNGTFSALVPFTADRKNMITFNQSATLTCNYTDLYNKKLSFGYSTDKAMGHTPYYGDGDGDGVNRYAARMYMNDSYQDTFLISTSRRLSASGTGYLSAEAPVYITLKKTASNPSCVAGSPLYSLIGTTYQLYTDSTCTTPATAYILDAGGNYTQTTDAKLIVADENGNTNTLIMDVGVYYAKETIAGKGYKLNQTPIRVNLTESNTAANPYIIQASDEPILDPVQIELAKIDSEGITIDPSDAGGATLEGAVFKVSYYNDYYDKDTYAGASPVRTWYIQTKYDTALQKYIAKFDVDYVASGYTSDAFYYNSVNQPNFPLGTVVITEEKASNGYKIDGSSMTVANTDCENAVFIGQVKQNGEYAEMYIDDGTGGFTQIADNETIRVFNKAADGSDLAVEEEVKRKDFSFVKSNYVTGVEMPDIYFKIKASTGEVHYVKTGARGYYSSEASYIPHTQYTNYYDRLFDDDDSNDYIDVNGTRTYIGDLDCGIWFYGTADTSEWDASLITNSKGALRYDENYVMTEEPGENNEGLQMIVPEEFSTDTTMQVVRLGIITNVPAPKIQTKEWDKTTGTHVTIVGEGIVNQIVDTVSYKYLTAGEKYTTKGILMELNEDGTLKGPLLDKNGDYIRANKTFTVDTSYVKSKQEKCGDIDVEYAFEGTNLKGKTFVIFEYLFAGEDDTLIPVNTDNTVDETGVLEVNEVIVKHTDETDINQIGYFPDLKTKAFTTADELKVMKLTEKMEVTDEVTYTGLNEGVEYKAVATLMYQDIRDNQTYPVLDENGEPVKKEQLFMAEAGTGTTKIDLPAFNGMQLVDENGDLICKGVVVYEEIRLGGVLYASEQDINNADQTVYIAQIKTTATDKATGLHIINPKGTVTIVDKVVHKNLIPGETYEVKGTLMDRDTNTPMKDAEGTVITAEKTFIADEPDGYVNLEFTFDASLMTGKVTVVFEDYYYKGKNIATHADLSDKGQTIWFPLITTTLREGESGTKNILYTDDVTLTDTVKYEKLPAGSYIMKGYLMNKDTEKAVCEGDVPVVAEVPFTVTDETGSVDVTFHFDATKTDLIKKDGSMSPTVCFEEVILAAHMDEQGHTETVTIPAYDEYVYQVKYICKDCQTECDTIEEMTEHMQTQGCQTGYDTDSRVINTIHHEETTQDKYVVDVEEMDINTVVAEEKSIDNVDQTVTPPEIHTTATDGATNSHVGAVSKETTIVDVIDYTGLIPDKEYTVKGQLYIQPETMIGTAVDNNGELATDTDAYTPEPLLVNGEPVTAETTFTPDKADGQVSVTFTFDSSALAGKTVTCFEDLYYKGIRVCTHSDITDSFQSVSYPSCHTTATNKEDGSHLAKPNDRVTIVDKVSFKNLVAGESYTARGKLMDAKTGEAVLVDGKEVISEATFVAQEKDGSVAVEFTFNASSLANRTTVVFEEVYAANGVLVCEHKDINSEEQTVVFSDQPKTGESGMIFILLAVLGIGVAGFAVTLIRRKKR